MTGDTMRNQPPLEPPSHDPTAWVPANGGAETAFQMNGYRLLYVWQQSTHRHAYLNLDNDTLLTNSEVARLFLR